MLTVWWFDVTGDERSPLPWWCGPRHRVDADEEFADPGYLVLDHPQLPRWLDCALRTILDLDTWSAELAARCPRSLRGKRRAAARRAGARARREIRAGVTVGGIRDRTGTVDVEPTDGTVGTSDAVVLAAGGRR